MLTDVLQEFGCCICHPAAPVTRADTSTDSWGERWASVIPCPPTCRCNRRCTLIRIISTSTVCNKHFYFFLHQMTGNLNQLVHCGCAQQQQQRPGFIGASRSNNISYEEKKKKKKVDAWWFSPHTARSDLHLSVCVCVLYFHSHLSRMCLLHSSAGKDRGRNQSCRCKCLHFHMALTGSHLRLRAREREREREREKTKQAAGCRSH